MSIRGLEPELEGVYSTVNTGNEGLRPAKLPQDFGYPDSDAPAELVADAIRAYMINPNFFKEVAPNAAAAIRAMVNSHPQLLQMDPVLACLEEESAAHQTASLNREP
jgi:hypothetical protein